MVACGEIQCQPSNAGSPRPQTSDSQLQYTWYPEKSQMKKPSMANKKQVIYEDDEEFSFPPLQKKKNNKNEKEMGGMCEIEEKLPNFPKSDNIIRTAMNLSRQASRGGRSTGPQSIFGQTKEGGMEQLMSKWRKEVKSREEKVRAHRRSASLNTPMLSGQARSSALQRVKSLTVPSGGGANERVQQPPPPVKVRVTKEVIHPGNSGTARLRYTSHWDKETQ